MLVDEYDIKCKAKAFEEMRRKLLSFVGRKVAVWTRYTQPVEGVLVFISLTSPFSIIVVDEDGYPHLFNLREVVEIASREKFTVP